MNQYILYFFSLIFVITTIFSDFGLKIQIVSAADQRLETTQAERAILQAEYDNLQVEMAALEKKKEGQKGQTASIDRDISILKTKIKKITIRHKSKKFINKKVRRRNCSKR